MPWMSYATWEGAVIGARVRVPAAKSSSQAFGKSKVALHLRGGAIGTLVNILRPGDPLPPYVWFAYPLDLAYAGEVRFRRQDNTPEMWRDFRNAHIDQDGDEVTVLITRKLLDGMEVEYGEGRW